MVEQRHGVSDNFRWAQLIGAIICMVLIANLQYGWTLFVNPMEKAHGWTNAEIQWGFGIFILLETWLTPVDGWLADKFGPKFTIAAGGILVAIGWIINSRANSLEMLYLGEALSGIGAGAVYATCVGNAVKWFPDRRGLAVGLTAAGYGAGSAISVIPIELVISSGGYEAAFFWFGLVQGGLVFLIAWALRAPEPSEVALAAPPKVAQSVRSYSPAQALRSPVFWLMYIMFLMVAASGLMATAQIKPIAADFNVANIVLVFGASTITVALIIDNVCNGGARPLFGWVSDHIGREYTMAIAFAIGGISYWLLGLLGHSPWLFVIFAALIYLTWGEIYSLFPSTCTDTFGPKFATVNLSLLYTAKGLAGFFAPIAAIIKTHTGSWYGVFVLTALMNFAVVFLALFALKPLRERYFRSEARAESQAQARVGGGAAPVVERAH